MSQLPGSRTSQVTLREVTTDNLRAVCSLTVSAEQTRFVAPNAVSIAEASFYDQAWYRAIYADEVPVGFAMLSIDVVKPEYYLWRFMIDARFQRQGFGRRSLDQIIAHVRTLPQAEELTLSYVPGEGNPALFYAKAGFEETGRVVEGERVMRLRLGPGEVSGTGSAGAGAGATGATATLSSVVEDRPRPGEVVRPARHAVWNAEKMGKSTLFQSERLLVGLNAFEPGQEHALHAHAGMDKVYYVLSGRGRFLLDGRELPMHAGEMLIAPDGMPHGIRNDGFDRLLVLVVLAGK